MPKSLGFGTTCRTNSPRGDLYWRFRVGGGARTRAGSGQARPLRWGGPQAGQAASGEWLVLSRGGEGVGGSSQPRRAAIRYMIDCFLLDGNKQACDRLSQTYVFAIAVSRGRPGRINL